jgi:hypothetical protein
VACRNQVSSGMNYKLLSTHTQTSTSVVIKRKLFEIICTYLNV